MRELDNDSIQDMLKKNYIGRNDQLAMFIRFVNSFSNTLSPVLAVDSPWGSGKTVFVKQLSILNKETISAPRIDNNVLLQYKDKYATYYFNAWENDYIEDPLQALILNMIDTIDTSGLNANGLKKAYKAINAAGFIKKVTLDGIDPSKMTKNDIIKEASLVAKRKQYIQDLVDKYVTKKEKRLLFIVDELDRCRPSFAVNLLEAIKHYFSSSNIVFVVATNNAQLAHTVCKYYGSSFDGAAYLDRFFDYSISLQRPNVDQYITNYLGDHQNAPTSAEIAVYLSMSMREIEHYFKSLELVEGYMAQSRYYRNESIKTLVKYILVPFVLALKVVRPSDAELLLKGEGGQLLEKLVLGCEDVKYKMEREFNKTHSSESFSDANAKKTVIDLYRQLFSNESGAYEMRELRSELYDVSSLISNYSTIKNSIQDDEIRFPRQQENSV